MIDISLYSGKCDFGDICEIHGIENILKSNVYIGWNIVPLRMETTKDLLPYYPYTIAFSASTEGVGVFRLSSESHVDREEREFLEFYQEEVVRYVKRCKRKKEEIDFGYYYGRNYPSYPEVATEILKRVANKDMSLDGIHLPMAQYYRERLYQDMLKQGYGETEAYLWVYKEFPKSMYEKKETD